MDTDQSTQLLMQLLWKASLISAPLLLVLLAVGVVVSVFQVVTQIQEMSLTFVPKLVAAVLVLSIAGPWMLNQWMSYSVTLINRIPQSLQR